jgi:MerR family transcriptional regulator, light-induced transcriptional regulator
VGAVTGEALGLHAVAEELGVHYQTAYRWVRSGRLPASLVGGRYAVAPEAVAQLAAERSAPRRPSARRPRGGFGGLADRMFRHLVGGQERDARLLVDGLADDGVSVTTIAQEVLAPALRRIGDEWHEGRLSISEEHRASAIVERILGEHHPTPRGRRRGTAAVAALSGDRHSLPTAMAAAALREDNWHVHHLGADVPGPELVRFVGVEPVDVVVLTVTAPEVRPAAEELVAELEAIGLRVLVGAAGSHLDELQQTARGD